MKKINILFLLLLCLALSLSSVSGIAESGSSAGQPFHYIDQDSFLSWLQAYDPEAYITWEPWCYYIQFFNSQYVSGVSADLSEDQSVVLAASIDVLDDIPKEAQNIINAICKVVGDKLSSKALKELKTGGWNNAKEVLSDKGKLSFSYDTRHVVVKFLVDESELLPVAAFYKAAAVKKVYDVSIGRRAEISKVKTIPYEDFLSLSEEEMIEYSNKKRSAYNAEVILDGTGCVTGILVSVPVEAQDAETIKAFLQDAASRLVAGDVLESVRSIINEKLASVMDDNIRESVSETIGAFSFSLYNNVDHINMSFSVSGSVPGDAVGFINGQKFAQD